MSVADYFDDLYDHLCHKSELKYQWKLPEWAYNPILLQRLMPRDQIHQYQLFHDCGKPFCLIYDNDGRRHFPNHAIVSEQKWIEYGGNRDIADLIRQDMDIHLLSDEQCEEFSKRPTAATLLLTGLAEIHSNADMFGGIESTSFKIKWKHLNRRGKRIVSLLEMSNG
ncbi:MAG: hypothetical protein WC284_03755 [Candidimonas sp.]